VNWNLLWKFKAPEKFKTFLWRVGTNALSTRENLLNLLEVDDPTCLLCNQESESICHLFLKCPIARALWFSTCWGFKAEEHTLRSHSDIVQLILNPPPSLCPAYDQWLVSLNMAFTLDEIWQTRNALLHLKAPVDIQASRQHILSKLRECSLFLSQPEPPTHETPILRWSPPPPQGYVKINTDAAIPDSRSALAVIARDDHGAILKVWARITPIHPPLQAKALALLWAVQLAKRERWSHVFIEADSKICIDAILSGDKDQAGSIPHIVFDIHDLALSFLSWSFYWVRRSCNQATHVAAKFTLDSHISCFFILGNLPPSMSDVCKEDALNVFSFS